MSDTIEKQNHAAWLESTDAELKRAWGTFPDPVAKHQFEVWQYMGTWFTLQGTWVHEFRHRSDPLNNGNRSNIKVPTPEGWTPTGVAPVIPVPVVPAPEPARPATSSPNRPNRYSGTCAACGARVAAQAGCISKRGGQWIVHHLVCVGKADGTHAPARRQVNTLRTSSGWSGTRNVRGRCEDAPCCGCCTY